METRIENVILNCQLQKEIARRENLINWIFVWPLSHLDNLILCPSISSYFATQNSKAEKFDFPINLMPVELTHDLCCMRYFTGGKWIDYYCQYPYNEVPIDRLSTPEGDRWLAWYWFFLWGSKEFFYIKKSHVSSYHK